MQVIVLRMDYKSSGIIENLQKQTNAANLNKDKILPPHITLQSFQQTNPLDLKKAVESWAARTKQIQLSFSSAGFFKQNGTFFLSPVFTRELAEFHRTVHLSTMEFTGQDTFYAPDKWIPHATIANGIGAPFWGPIFARLSMEFEPFAGIATAVECWTVVDGKTENEWSIFLSE